MEKVNIRAEVLRLLRESPNLTNQQIRKRLHEKGLKFTKTQLNTTLHELGREKTLVYEIKGNDKFWKVFQPELILPRPNPVKEESDEVKEYKALLEKVKSQASLWKESNPTNLFPKRKDKIENFVENSLIQGLSPELYKKIAQDLFLYGWD